MQHMRRHNMHGTILVATPPNVMWGMAENTWPRSPSPLALNIHGDIVGCGSISQPRRGAQPRESAPGGMAQTLRLIWVL